jgi:hypothetical protein
MNDSDDAQAWRYWCARASGWAMWGLMALLLIGAFVGCVELQLRAAG